MEEEVFSNSSPMSTNDTNIPPYSHEQMIKVMTKFIFARGLSLDFGSCPVDYFQCLNPNYREIKRKTVLKQGRQEYSKMKKQLRSDFASLSNKIALSCDIWRNEWCVDYIRLTAHWIDTDWCIHRRVIAFKVCDFLFSSDPIAESIAESVDNNSWGIKDKVISITVDDLCDDDDVFMGLRDKIPLVLDGKLFRVKCVSRALGSCVIAGFLVVYEHIAKIRNGFAKPADDHRDSYIYLCEKHGLKVRYGMWFNTYSWDYTWDMLRRCLPYKEVLNEFNETHWPDEEKITERDWEIVSVFSRFLDVFYEAVDCASANYYPSSSGILLHLVNIAKLFSEYRGSVVYVEKIAIMEETFLEHYKKIPDLFCLAAIMDPRIKLSGCECLMESFYQCIDNKKINFEQERMNVSDLLRGMYSLYASGYRQTQQSKNPPSCSGTGGFAWSLISRKKQKTGDFDFDELTFYLEAPHTSEGPFDILKWWCNQESVYPVLASMARDLFTKPVSTLASDCAFDMNLGRKIRDESYRLQRQDTLKMYACLKDWFNVEGRTQGKREPFFC